MSDTGRSAAHVILSAAKDLKLRILRSFAVFAAQDDEAAIHLESSKFEVRMKNSEVGWSASSFFIRTSNFEIH
jgi:hypothetical protein